MRPQPIDPVAQLPTFVQGLAVIRGAPTPVVDLGALLGDPSASAATRFVTVRAGPRNVALAVEEVLKVFRLPSTLAAGLPPLIREASAERVTALGTSDAQLLRVLSASRILSDQVWARLEAAA